MEDSIIAQINKKDEYFDSAQFKGRVSNMYVSLQEAWEKKEVSNECEEIYKEALWSIIDAAKELEDYMKE